MENLKGLACMEESCSIEFLKFELEYEQVLSSSFFLPLHVCVDNNFFVFFSVFFHLILYICCWYVLSIHEE